MNHGSILPSLMSLEHENVRKVYTSTVRIIDNMKRAMNKGVRSVWERISGKTDDEPHGKVLIDEVVPIDQIGGVVEQ